MVIVVKKSISLYLIATLVFATALASYLYMPTESEASYIDSTTNSGTSFTPAVAVPSGVQADDIVILVASTDHISADFATGDWPTGFTELSEVDLSLDGQSVAIGWKRLTGADSGSYTFGNVNQSGNWIAQAYAFRGRDTVNPPTLSTVTNDSANASPVSIDASTITALAGDDLLWVSSPDVNTTGAGNGHAAPADYNEKEDAENGFTNLSGATRESVSAGATGTVTGTLTLTSGTSGWAAFLVRIPAAAAPPVSATSPHINVRGGGGYTGVSFSDDFNRADSDSLGANWTEVIGDSDISSNTWRQSTGGFANIFAVHNTPTGSINQYLKITTPTSNNTLGVVLRYQNSSSGFYSLALTSGSETWEWYYVPDASSFGTSIQSSAGGGFSPGNTYGFTITGTGNDTVVRIWRNPTADVPVSTLEWDSGDNTPDFIFTNNPVTSADIGQYLGLFASSASADNVTIDNFFGGTPIALPAMINIRGGAGGNVNFR